MGNKELYTILRDFKDGKIDIDITKDKILCLFDESEIDFGIYTRLEGCDMLYLTSYIKTIDNDIKKFINKSDIIKNIEANEENMTVEEYVKHKLDDLRIFKNTVQKRISNLNR